MSKYDLIAFDMDGTLLNSRKELPEENAKAIRSAYAAGKQIAFASGRCVAELAEFSAMLPEVRYAICMNGAMVYDLRERSIIAENPIPHETVLDLFTLSKQKDVMIQMMEMRSLIQHDKQEHIREYHAEAYEKLFYDTAFFADDLYEYYILHKPSIYKFTPYARTLEDRDYLYPMIRKLGLATALAEETGIECSAPGVSKGSGLEALCTQIGIPIDRTIAVGDADNDLSMLEKAGLAAGMGNANSNVLRIADVRVKDNDHAGCAEVIRKYLL